MFMFPSSDGGPAEDSALDRPPLGFDLARRLADEIIRGILAPGEKLVETDICARHGVSRSPLREALGILEARGLVVRRHRYGVRVAPLSLANLDDITLCRLPLEAQAAALVAEHPEHLALADQLEVHLARMKAEAEAGRIDACFTANLGLMDALHRWNPNPVLGRILSELNLPAQRYRYLVYRHRPETRRMLIESNERMIAAIRAGDGTQARATTEAMVRGSWEDLRAHLGDLIPPVEDMQ